MEVVWGVSVVFQRFCSPSQRVLSTALNRYGEGRHSSSQSLGDLRPKSTVIF